MGCGGGMLGIGGTAPAPIAKAKAPTATCPSLAETVRQLTVYVPSASDGKVVRVLNGSPGTGMSSPLLTTLPSTSSRRTVESLGSGASVKLILRTCGACARVAPSAGSDERTSACASAGIVSRRAAAAPNRAPDRKRRALAGRVILNGAA